MNRDPRRPIPLARQTAEDPRVGKSLRLGLKHHQLGQLREAETCYRDALAIEPDHARALHLLGVLAHQVGLHATAADLIGRATTLDPRNASGFSDLGAALKHLGRLDEAVTALRRAIEIKPDLADAHCNLGAVLRDLGRLDEAVTACAQAIRLRPDDAEAHANLGVLYFDRGRYVDAVDSLSHAIRIEPRSPQVQFSLGHALRALSKPDHAAAAYRQAIQFAPDHVEAHYSLGALLCEEGRLRESVAACRQAIRIRPDCAEAYLNLGAALCAQGEIEEAVAACRRAIQLRPDWAEGHCGLGQALRAQGRLEEAMAAHRQAIALKADYADAYSGLGRALHDQNVTADAIAAFRRAIVLDPESAAAHNSLGAALRAIGHLPEARVALEQAVRLAPRNASYRRNLSEIARFVAGDARLAAMEQLARDHASLSVDERIELHFGLGKAYEDLGRHAEAFRQWLDGNALKRRQIPYDEALTLGGLDRIRAAFTPDLYRTRQNVGHPSSVPLFIVGMMRSGTTLVEQILASHPQVFGGGEMKHLGRAVRAIPTTPGGAAIFPELVSAMNEADFRDLGGRYLQEIESLAPDAAHITDKMPSNFMFVGLIHLALPNAIIIHTVRDPADTCLSCFSKLFSAEQSHAYDLAELGRYYRHHQALMAHWHSALPPGRILDVRYEDVVADLEGQARRILAHCGLEWHARCLSFHETERPVRTASATQVRQPIYDSSIGRWRVHEPSLGPLLAELGLEADPEA